MSGQLVIFGPVGKFFVRCYPDIRVDFFLNFPGSHGHFWIYGCYIRMTEKDRMSDRSIKDYFIGQSEMFIQNGPIFCMMLGWRMAPCQNRQTVSIMGRFREIIFKRDVLLERNGNFFNLASVKVPASVQALASVQVLVSAGPCTAMSQLVLNWSIVE